MPLPPFDFLVAGLGNPGEKYSRTRHNAGFMVLDLLGLRLEASRWKTNGPGLAATAGLGPKSILLLKPLTFMNRSGIAVASLMERASALIVVHDDLDLPFGALRVRVSGGHGGHNGIRSIIEELGTAEFCRVKIGVGRPPEGVPPPDHVLSQFSPAEEAGLPLLLERAASAVTCIIEEGPVKAMNLFNQAKPEEVPTPESQN